MYLLLPTNEPENNIIGIKLPFHELELMLAFNYPLSRYIPEKQLRSTGLDAIDNLLEWCWQMREIATT